MAEMQSFLLLVALNLLRVATGYPVETLFLANHHHEHEEKKKTAMVIMLGVILLLTMIFEHLLRLLTRYLKRHEMTKVSDMKDILLRELTGLGFIGLFLFALTRFGFIQQWSDHLFGETEVEKVAKKELAEEGEPIESAPTVLFELFEGVHLFIFLIMFLYILMAAAQICLGAYRRARWRRLDKMTYEEVRKVVAARNDRMMLEFWIFRRRFLQPSSPLYPTTKYSDSFQYSQYLSERFGEVLKEIVELPFTSWMAVVLIAILARPAMSFPALGMGMFLSFCALGLAVASYSLALNIQLVKVHLRPRLSILRQYMLDHPNASDHLPSAPIDGDPTILPNTLTQRILQRVAYVNSQEALFVFGAKGIHYFQRILQLSAFLHVALLAIILRMVLSGWWQRMLFHGVGWLYAIGPLVILALSFVLIWPDLLTDLTYVSSTAMMADNKTIEEVDKEVEHHTARRNQQIFNFLRFKTEMELHGKNTLQQRREAGLRVIAEHKLTENRMLMDAFHAFQEETATAAGHLSLPQFKRMLHIFNAELEDRDKIIDGWIETLGIDVEEGFNFQEFLLLVVAIFPPDADRGTNVTAMEIFAVVDVDCDGLISTDDLTTALAGLEPPASDREIRALLREMSGGRTIMVEDKMLRRWASKMAKAESDETGHEPSI